MQRIDTLDHVQAGLDHLVVADPRLVGVLAIAGSVPLRRRDPGFVGLSRIVCAQQISVKAADAIWGRVETLIGLDDPVGGFLAQTPEALRGAGLSASKVRTLSSVARAVADGALDIEALAAADPLEASAALTLHPGIGPWTAEIFLMFCVGHPDIWPGGDVALQAAVGEAFGLDARPGDKATRAMAEAWAPWRSVAARLFWAYYGARRSGQTGVPV